jgi:hypothetical protein
MIGPQEARAAAAAGRAGESRPSRTFVSSARGMRNRSPVSGSNGAPRGRTSGAFTRCAGTLASRRSAGQPVDVPLGSDGADADEFVSAATRGGVEAAAERTGTIIVRAGGRSSGISSATSSRASSLERWKNRGSTSARFSGVRTFATSKMVERSSDPLGSLECDCVERSTGSSSPTHGLLASRSALRRLPRAEPSRPPPLRCPSAPAAHPDPPRARHRSHDAANDERSAGKPFGSAAASPPLRSGCADGRGEGGGRRRPRQRAATRRSRVARRSASSFTGPVIARPRSWAITRSSASAYPAPSFPRSARVASQPRARIAW